MTWFKVDDGLHSHPKWLATPLPARGLWATAGSWCASHLTDGHVPRHALPALGATTRHAADLVRSGLWDEDEDGWRFHDWAGFQPTSAEVLEERRRKADAGRLGGLASGRARNQKRTKPEAESKQVLQQNRSSGSHLLPELPNPRPDPSRPISTRRPSDSRGNGVRPDDDELSTGICVPDAVWTRYAELRLAQKTDVRDPVPWKRTCAANARSELGSQAAGWWAEFDLDANRLAQALVDGHPPRYASRRSTNGGTPT